MKKISSIISVILTLSLSLSACSQNLNVSADNMMENVQLADVAPIVLDAPGINEGDKSGALTNFSLDLLEQVYDGKNVLLSPLSIASAFGMVQNGARGNTLSQMEDVFGTDRRGMNDFLYAYRTYLPNEKDYRVTLGNSIWIRDMESFRVKDTFLETNKTYYDAEAYKGAFDESTRSDMNRWVENKTEGMIKDILAKPIPENAVMYLINTLYFDAKWLEKEDESEIETGTFYKDNGSETLVEYLSSQEEGYFELENAVGFLKPYEDRTYSFVGILPDEGLMMEDFIKSIDGERLKEAIQTANEPLALDLPMFNFSYDKELSETFQRMGMTDAFSTVEADFGDIGQYDDGKISISQVIHMTAIEVSRKGTKAAAATVIEMSDGSSQEENRIRLDRPFFFMIVDNELEMPLFMGILMDPDAKKVSE